MKHRQNEEIQDPQTRSRTTAHDRRVRRRWIRRHRRRYLRRAAKRTLLFVLAVGLGIFIAFGSLIAGGFFVIGGLNIDFLQKQGVVSDDVDQYLTQDGQKDLTSMSLLELYNDMMLLRTDLANHTLQTVIDRYGVVLPEQVAQALPAELMSLPLDQLLADNVGQTVTNTLTLGTILAFLPEGTLSPSVIEVLSPRPLSMLTEGNYVGLFTGVKLGFFMGVTFDEEGNVVYAVDGVPTLQEVLAPLDLGNTLGTITQNGDFLALLATDLGDSPVGSLFAGMTDGALLEKLTAGKTMRDIILLNEETGRYELSFVTMAQGCKLGEMMSMTLVGDTWYSAYTDNDDDTDDVKAGGLMAVLADVPLSDLMNGTLDLNAVFEGMYLGDLLEGYEKGDAQYDETDPANPVLTGYAWQKDSAPVGGVMAELANIAVSDILGGTVNISGIINGRLVGDLMGFDKVADVWYDGTEPVSGILAKFADLTVDELSDSDTVTDTVKTITVSEAMDYQYNEDDHKWHAKDPVSGEYTGAEPTAVLALLMETQVGSLSDKLDTLYLGEVMGYTTEDEGATWYKDGVLVTDITTAFASLTLAQLEEDGKIQSVVDDLALGKALGFTYHESDHTWYNGADPVEGMILEFIDLKVGELSDSSKLSDSLKNITVADAMDYKYNETDHKWHAKDAVSGEYTGAEPSSLLGLLMETKVGDLSDKLDTLYLGEVMGYTTEDDGATWYKDGVLVTDITTAFAPLTLEELNEDGKIQSVVDDMALGKALGYTYHESDHKWYDGADPVTGILEQLVDLKVGELSDNTKLTNAVKNIRVADVMDYKYNETDHKWHAKDPVSGEYTGAAPATVLALLMGNKVGELSGRLDAMYLGEVMGYTTEDEGATWYNDGVLVTDITTAFAPLTLAQLEEDGKIQDVVNDMALGKALGYTYHESDHKWYNGADPVEGIILQFVDLKVAELSDTAKLTGALKNVTVAGVMDYKYNTVDGKWHAWDPTTEDYTGAEPATVLALLMASRVGDLQTTLQGLHLGDIMGYTSPDNGATWYNSGVLVTDMTASFAKLTLAEVEQEGKIKGVVDEMTLGKALGFTKVGGVWYSVYTDNGDDSDDERAGSLLAALADTQIQHLSGTVDTMQIGTMMGYTKPDTTWYDGTEPVTGIMAALADSTLNGLSTRINDLTVADVFADPTAGVLGLVAPTTKITQIDTAFGSVFSVDSPKKIADIEAAGLISFTTSQRDMLNDLLGAGWETTYTFRGFVNELLARLDYYYQFYQTYSYLVP